jgi:hypothetical protein
LWSSELTKAEFQALAQAYGGDLARWPAAVREDASLLAAAHPQFAQSVLALEVRLDEALEALPRPLASRGLFDRIVAGAPTPRRRPCWFAWLASAGVGTALAGATAAGMILGVQLSQASATSADASAQAVADLDVFSVSEEG